MVPVRDVVLHGDMRSPRRVAGSRASTLSLRAAAAVAILVVLDAVAATVAILVVPALAGVDHALAADRLSTVIVVTIVGAAVTGLYGRRRRSHARLVIWGLAVLAALCVVSVLLHTTLPLVAVTGLWAIGAATALTLRYLFERWLAGPLGVDVTTRRILVVGDTHEAGMILEAIDEGGRRPARLVGVVDVDDLQSLEAGIEQLRPTTVVLAARDVANDQLETVLDVSRRRKIRLQIRAEHLGDEAICLLPGTSEPVFAVRPSYLRGTRYLVKRTLDVTASAVLLVVLSPFFLVVAILTRLSSPGPAIFVSWRMGVCERPFPCFKFRTMCADAELRQAELESQNEAEGCLFKLEDDPRVTSVGRFLRRTSLDELPQLVNVLLGQMSLVGPRPLPLRDVRLMEDGHKGRHVVLPGMTGLWQVSGRSQLGGDDMMKLDLKYIRTWSLRADFSILWRTVGVIIHGKGAY